MNIPFLRLAPVFLAALFALTASVRAQGSFALLHSLFDPNTNAQAGASQGSSVAVDGDIAVVGAPRDDVGGQDSGVVKIYDATTGALLHTLPNPSPAETDYFGSSVAISGPRVVVGAYQDDTGQPNAGSAYVYDLASATPTVPVLTLTNPSPAFADNFGNSVAISGTRVVVGAGDDDTGLLNAGSAYVYDLASAMPAVPVIILTNPSPAFDERFGNSVAISGTRVVVGAYQDDTGAEDAGSTYVYDLASATPTVPVLTLTNPSPAGYDHFGSSVAIAGTRVVVGTPDDDSGATGAGSAYVYDLASATPTVPVATLTNPSPAEYDYFGRSVAISGTRAVVGTPGDGTGAPEAGSAYVYDLASATPTVPVLTLTNPSPAEYDYLGSSAAIAGTRVVVGTPYDDSGANGAGSAYVYDLASATPTLPVVTLNNPSFASNDYFGYSVAISGTRVVVGAYSDDTGGINAGSAYVFDLASATPTAPVLTLTNPSPEMNDWFGSDVAISSTRVVVGVPSDRIGGIFLGSTHVYDLASATPSVPVHTLTNPNPSGSDSFGTSVAISGNRVVVGAFLNDTGASDAGSAYVYDLASATPTVPVLTLTNPSPAVDNRFGFPVAISGTRVVVGATYDDAGGFNSGSAYVYDLASATDTVPVLTVTNPSPMSFAGFASSVAISGTLVAVGVFRDDTTYVYDLASATPTVPLLTLTNPSPAGYVGFGYSVAISGTRVVVGAYGDDTGASDTGSAYVYDLTSATPTVPVSTLHNPSPAAHDNFGDSVAIDGTTIVVGAPHDDTNASDRGAAYIFGPVPQLRIVPAGPGTATLSWSPVTSSGFVLQCADSLASGGWSNAPSGAQNPVTIATTNAAKFYRLFQP